MVSKHFGFTDLNYFIFNVLLETWNNFDLGTWNIPGLETWNNFDLGA